MKDLISVIIPVYNGQKYIKNLFHCFISQSYKEFELIFINDGSSDNSTDEINKYIKYADFEVKIIEQINQGVSVARNKGIIEASGKFICFCDVDDWIHRDFLYMLYHNIYNNDIIICKTKNIKNNSIINITEELTKNPVILYNSQDFLFMYMYGKIKTGVWGALFRSDVIKSNNILFANGYKYSEDLHFMWRILGLSHTIALLPEELYFYKWNVGSAMSKFDKNRFDGYTLMRNLCPFWEKINPQFAPLFRQYVPARIMWSIMRQASCKMTFKQFRLFFQKYKLKHDMKNLLTYKNINVAISALIYLIYPYGFYLLCRKIGSEKVH